MCLSLSTVHSTSTKKHQRQHPRYAHRCGLKSSPHRSAWCRLAPSFFMLCPPSLPVDVDGLTATAHVSSQVHPTLSLLLLLLCFLVLLLLPPPPSSLPLKGAQGFARPSVGGSDDESAHRLGSLAAVYALDARGPKGHHGGEPHLVDEWNLCAISTMS